MTENDLCRHGRVPGECETCAAWESAIHNQHRAETAEHRVAYLEDELSMCEHCDRSLLVSITEAAKMERDDPYTARPAGAVKTIICCDCWNELCLKFHDALKTLAAVLASHERELLRRTLNVDTGNYDACECAACVKARQILAEDGVQ